MKESPLFWPAKLKGDTLFVLDETLLPSKQKYVSVKTTTQAVAVIKQMKTRAFGQFLVVLNTFLLVLKQDKKSSDKVLFAKLKKAADALNKSRPTFPFSEVTGMVLGWAQGALAQNKDLRSTLEKSINGFLIGIRGRRLERVQKIAEVIAKTKTVLTHCNVSGELAMAAAICKAKGKTISFFATETRPYFQGAKLTCWELKKAGVPVTLVADNAVGTLLRDKMIDAVVVGSDRSCANGDFANKIGTLQIAVMAKEFGVPFYVLTQPSNKVKKGKDIPIEIRHEDEILKFNGKRIAPKGVKGLYPGFDVVPHKFVTKTIAINVN
ncbi:MAG: S-methyl-5-thioribose-1-phosphate isomerase [Candidatus Aceula meridiana]|nr:S-methyl-5-thioribose-1-phosphate isomerase [Candidatus Aceula meridiana]